MLLQIHEYIQFDTNEKRFYSHRFLSFRQQLDHQRQFVLPHKRLEIRHE